VVHISTGRYRRAAGGGTAGWQATGVAAWVVLFEGVSNAPERSLQVTGFMGRGQRASEFGRIRRLHASPAPDPAAASLSGVVLSPPRPATAGASCSSTGRDHERIGARGPCIARAAEHVPGRARARGPLTASNRVARERAVLSLCSPLNAVFRPRAALVVLSALPLPRVQ